MYRIKIEWNNKSIEKTLFSNETLSIGREKTNDVVIPHKYISKKHCKIFIKENKLFIQDLGSTNGTYVNNIKIKPHTPQIIAPESSVELTKQGIVKIKIYKSSLPKKEKYIRIYPEQKIITIGRASDNDIVVSLPTVSRYHARIIKEGTKLYVEDLNSTNGTFLNGKRVYGKKEIKPGDKLSIGSYILILQSYEKLTHSSLITQGFELKGVKLSYSVKDKDILKDIDFIAKSGELVGIIGPSGGGKTTLLNILAGICPESKGKVILNDDDLYENYDYYCTNIGYAPQDDIVHKELTVFQSLYYTAKLRLPSDTSKEERLKRVNEVLNQLGISHIKNSKIGSPEEKIISGGERKRVNIGQELIVDPPVLFLDEPATGLDPHWRKDVVERLRKLADTGKIVVAITHDIQDEESASYFDKIIVIAKGKEIYFGPAKELFSFFGKQSVAEIFEELNNPEKVEKWHKKFKTSKYYKDLQKKLANITPKINYQNIKEIKRKRNLLSQFITLTSRYITRKLSDKLQTSFLILQAPLIGVILSSIYNKLSDTVLLLGLSSVWFGLFSSMREIVSEKAIFRREKRAGVEIFPYVASKFAVPSILAVFQALTLLGTVGIKIKEVWEYFPLLFSILLLSILTSITLGLFISSLLPREDSVIPLITVITILQVVFSGLLKPLNTMPFTMRILAEITPSRWVIEGLLNIIGAKEIITNSGFGTNLLTDIYILTIFLISFFILTTITLEIQEK